MSKFLMGFRTFLRSEDGPTVVEYTVLMMLIVIALIAVIGQLGGALSDSYTSSTAELNNM